jgi:hypothetical protein
MVGVPRLARWRLHAVLADRLADLQLGQRRITHGPKARPISSAVIAAITARKVRYWKTRRKPHARGQRLQPLAS